MELYLEATYLFPWGLAPFLQTGSYANDDAVVAVGQNSFPGIVDSLNLKRDNLAELHLCLLNQSDLRLNLEYRYSLPNQKAMIPQPMKYQSFNTKP
jgi:hypothetical protein